MTSDLTIAQLEDDPHPHLARLRAEEPVAFVPALGGWLVTSRDLALAVMRDSAAFTVDDPRFSTAQVVGPSMLSLDGPVHARHRDAFSRPFRPARTRERFTAFVEAEVGGSSAGSRRAGAAELRGDLAGPLAVAVVTEALGLHGVDAATVRSWYGAFVEAVSAITAGGTAPGTPGRRTGCCAPRSRRRSPRPAPVRCSPRRPAATSPPPRSSRTRRS
ncbi:hypothetical protein LUX57_04735 [Actinomadura madurae]|uniref:hypothetical protein n=1 Tax=Actinomadura madurae TaxID=1993 RepID=UPI0020D1FFD1|nr:hypothetical protein [Actinomadura madurae]MCP9964551.1 hypothetical protein [Actinomadura madurae]